MNELSINKQIGENESMNDKYKAIADETRRKILDFLESGRKNAGEIAIHCESTRPNISQHLSILRDSGLVKSEKEGLHVFFSLSQPHFQETYKGVQKMLSIKEKMLGDIAEIAKQKKCELTMGVANSQDEGTFYVMKDETTILSYHYSFHLSTFSMTGQIPSLEKTLNIAYTDAPSIQSFYEQLKQELNEFLDTVEYKEKCLTKEKIHLKHAFKQLLHEYNPHLFGCKEEKELTYLKSLCATYVQTHYPNWTQEMYMEEMQDAILELTSYGKLHFLTSDPTVTEIYINGTKGVYIKQNGQVYATSVSFKKQEHVDDLAKLFAQRVGVEWNTNQPIKGILNDEFSVHILYAHLTHSGTSITLKRCEPKKRTMEMLIKEGMLTPTMATFLEKAVHAKCNILVTGAVGTGKTTFLNALADLLPMCVHLITVESQKELNLEHENTLSSVAWTPYTLEPTEEVTTDSLLQHFSELTDSRLLLGELSEADTNTYYTMINSGFQGSMTSSNGSTIESALLNINRMGELQFTEEDGNKAHFLRQRVKPATDLVVHLTRLHNGKHIVSSISEIMDVTSTEKQVMFLVNHLFEWKDAVNQEEGVTGSHLQETDIFSERLKHRFHAQENCSLPNFYEQIRTLTTFKPEHRYNL